MHVRIHSVGKKFPRFQEFKEKVGPAKFCYLVKSTLARNRSIRLITFSRFFFFIEKKENIRFEKKFHFIKWQNRYKLLRNVRLTKKKYLQRIMKFLEDSAIIEEKIAKTKG